MAKKKISKAESLKRAALHYHSNGRKGKIEVVSTKPFATQHDLSLAYTPGVAEPCKEIQANPLAANEYTAKGNLVAVVTNGTAVLGLGNIGALAGKPVMEGKGVLFKKFADIDVFDIELDSEDPDEIIKAVKLMEPTFGGVNLEDIKAPECFYIEERLREEMNIPVFHDDQHGTAIISGAALLNAVELAGKKIEDVRLVMSGAGAAGIACANFYISLGVKAENLFMTDSRGVLWKGREDEGTNKYKTKFYRDTDARSLEDIMKGADVFCGVSVKDLLSVDMVKSMADRPIIFAMANPDPEISYPVAIKARPDAIVATGRSDYPNQVNNVLGFPFVFRGALDVAASSINEEMKVAVAQALANLAKEEVPDMVKKVYDTDEMSYGPNYIIPKPFDPRVLYWTAPAVAQAAMDSGVATKKIDIEKYKEFLMERMDVSRQVMRKIYSQAKKDPKRVVLPEGNNPKVIWAATEMVNEGVAHPILLTKDKEKTLALFDELNHDPEGIEIVEPRTHPKREEFIQHFFEERQRKGVTPRLARMEMRNYFTFGSMMVKEGLADAMLGGITAHYPDVLRPALETIGTKEEGRVISSLYMVIFNNQMYFFTDCTVNINPTAEQLIQIVNNGVEQIKKFNLNPKVSMLSFSNFGSVRTPETDKMTEVVKHFHENQPELQIDGPVQANFALDPALLKQEYPFTTLTKKPNLLVFPNLDAGNISLKLLDYFSDASVIGPLITGLDKPIHVIPRNCSVDNIVHMAAIASVDAQEE